MKEILNEWTADRKLERMALEIAERHHAEPEIVIIGIKENGCIVADRVAGFLAKYFKGSIKQCSLSINKKLSEGAVLDPAPSLDGAYVLLVDDVVNSGKTIFHAFKPILESKPSHVEVLALLARTHKAFPIAVDYIGLSVSTTLQDHIEVQVENGRVLRAVLM